VDRTWPRHRRRGHRRPALRAWPSAAANPNLERFMDGEGPAWYSPPLLAGVRERLTGRNLVEKTASP
jgi:hypothetical protein